MRLIALEAAAGLSLVLAARAVVDLVVSPEAASVASLLAYEAAVVAVVGVLLAGLFLGRGRGAAVTDLVLQLGQARSGTLRASSALLQQDPSSV
jgi:hypothetical protein